MDEAFQRDLVYEIRRARKRERAAAAEEAAIASDAGVAECRGERRAYREAATRLGGLLARVEAEEDKD